MRSPSFSHRPVLPSMSVNSIVIAPDDPCTSKPPWAGQCETCTLQRVGEGAKWGAGLRVARRGHCPDIGNIEVARSALMGDAVAEEQTIWR